MWQYLFDIATQVEELPSVPTDEPSTIDDQLPDVPETEPTSGKKFCLDKDLCYTFILLSKVFLFRKAAAKDSDQVQL